MSIRAKLVCCLLLLSHVASAQDAKGWYNAVQHGAIGSGQFNCTRVIQDLINKCSGNGGGTVYFPAGRYLSGQLYLRSNVHVYLDAGAVLLASREPSDYRVVNGYQADDQVRYPNETCLLYADSVSNVTISGRGTVDGQAEHEWLPLKDVDNFIARETELARKAGVEMKRYYAKDPKVRLVFINRARNIQVRDVTILNSPDWGLHIGNADDVLIDGVRIFSSLEKGVNSDGIDIDGCTNVRISNCYVRTGDDAICLKSTLRNGKYGHCENIVITNCTLESSSAGLKIGTESHGNFRRIIFSNCVVSNTNRGINIVVRDGALVEDILFTDLILDCTRRHFNWWGDGDPIRFILLKRHDSSRLGAIRNVTVRNVTARGMGTSLIQGFPGKPLENIRLENVDITISPEQALDKRCHAILATNGVDGLQLDNVRLQWNLTRGIPPGWTYAMDVKRSRRVHINDLLLTGPVNRKKMLRVTEGSSLEIDGLRYNKGAEADVLEKDNTVTVKIDD